jgi:(2S)-methylsuccinyl-CoA dehydrogenase
MSAEVLAGLDEAAYNAAKYLKAARDAVKALVVKDGKVDRVALDREQHVVHGLAWVATYAETLREVRDWARALSDKGALTETDQLLAKLLAAEYSAQLAGGVAMTQVEIIRPDHFGVAAPAVAFSITQAEKTRLAALLHDTQGRATVENTNLDADFEMIRDQFRKFADDKIMPHAHGWHCRDELIPIEILNEMGALGVFGLTIPEEYGGSGLGKSSQKNSRAPGSVRVHSVRAAKSRRS